MELLEAAGWESCVIQDRLGILKIFEKGGPFQVILHEIRILGEEICIRSGPTKQTKERSVHELFHRGIPEQKFNVNRACFPKENHQNSQKWTKFMNFSFWPFLWFGLPGRLLIVRPEKLGLAPWGSGSLSSTSVLLRETFLQNPKDSAEFWGTFRSPDPSFEDRLFSSHISQSPDLPLPHGLAPSEISDHLGAQKKSRNKGFFLGVEHPFLDLVSQTPHPKGVGVVPCLLQKKNQSFFRCDFLVEEQNR